MGGSILPPSMGQGPSSDGKKPEPRACPKCGQLLLDHALRSEMDGAGKPEMVRGVILLLARFFYLARQQGAASRTLTTARSETCAPPICPSACHVVGAHLNTVEIHVQKTGYPNSGKPLGAFPSSP